MAKLQTVIALLLVALVGASAAGTNASMLRNAAPPAAADGEVPDEAVLSFRGPVPADIEPWLASHGGSLLLRDDVVHWVSARFADREATEQAIAAAQQRSDVQAAEHDGTTWALVTPNDPLYAQQWGFPAIGAPAAWDLTLGSHAVKVSVLDTGMDITHPDLAANACGPFASFVPSEPTIQDFHGHGTHTSGTVAAVTGNGIGVAGTSQSCLMDGKVLSGGGGGQWTWLAAGLRWAADNGAAIVSMSLGGSAIGQTELSNAIYYAAVTKGVLLVAAAGNSGCPSTVGWPAMYNEVIAVAALRAPGDTTATFSSCGPKVEQAAPGQDVLSTWHGGGYISLSGTSMATPHVAGAAALLKAAHPELTANAMRCMLDLTADDLAVPGRDALTGWGRVDPRGAIDYTQQLLDQGYTAADLDEVCTHLLPLLGWGGEPSLPPPGA